LVLLEPEEQNGLKRYYSLIFFKTSKQRKFNIKKRPLLVLGLSNNRLKSQFSNYLIIKKLTKKSIHFFEKINKILAKSNGSKIKG
jgi:hypothetical protein